MSQASEPRNLDAQSLPPPGTQKFRPPVSAFSGMRAFTAALPALRISSLKPWLQTLFQNCPLTGKHTHTLSLSPGLCPLMGGGGRGPAPHSTPTLCRSSGCILSIRRAGAGQQALRDPPGLRLCLGGGSHCFPLGCLSPHRCQVLLNKRRGTEVLVSSEGWLYGVPEGCINEFWSHGPLRVVYARGLACSSA